MINIKAENIFYKMKINDINPIIIELLKNRGVCNEADALEFLSASPRHTYDPFLLKGMKEAVELIDSHLKRKSRICIFGDYDADGVTSVTLMMTALSKLTDNLTYYIPSRFSEGYGLNMEAMDIVAGDHTDLIITVDCGSVSYKEVEYAKSLWMDIIVTDHHSITDSKADCILINPKQADCSYPFKELAGVGVAFKLVQALSRKGMLDKGVLSEVLDLVAIGTIGDIVPLVDENRTIVKFGLRSVNSGRREGLSLLMDKIGLKRGDISSENVAFAIIPHVNAAGRLKDASLGVKLLLSDDELIHHGLSEGAMNQEGEFQGNDDFVEEIILCNQKRKAVQEEDFQRCRQLVDEDNLPNFIIINGGKAHEGITGIVAGKLKDLYYRPVIVVTDLAEDETMLKGTGRSIFGINLYELLKHSENLFTKFGGHAGACGFTIPKANFEQLKTELEENMQALLEEKPKLLEKISPAEIELKVNQVDMQLISDLKLLEPFGAANPMPVFAFKNVNISNINYLGQNANHARFFVSDGVNNLQCILFNKAKDYEHLLVEGSEVNIAASCTISTWNDKSRLQLTVQEISPVKE